MRNFVAKHPAYRGDSVVNEEVNFDLLEMCRKVSVGEALCPELSPCYSSRTTEDIPPAVIKAEAKLQTKKHANNGSSDSQKASSSGSTGQ